MNIAKWSIDPIRHGRWRMAQGRSTSGRHARRFVPRPDLEFLEERLTLTGNIAITAASVVDANENPISAPSIGEWVYIEADFTTTNLPSDASYRVSFTVNGLTLDSSYVTWGAGTPGTSNWNLYWGTFIATPGKNQVTAIVDPDHSVPETSYADNSMSFTFNAGTPAVSNFITYTVAQIRDAYGVNSIPDFGSSPADGTGQTIALVEAGNEPTILTDLDGFDQAMSLTLGSTETLYQQYGPASSFVNVYNQNGTNITPYIGTSGSNGVPAEDPTGHWEGEETLDVEWAHAMAPGATIDIIEVNDDANWPTNLLAGDKLAASLPDVSAISNSWGLVDSSVYAPYDSSTFVTPSGHTGVTFLTASNDNGANVYPSAPSNPPPSAGNDGYYPATSPNVVAVGGTQLTLNSDAYGSETGWSYPAPSTIVEPGSSSYAQTGSWASQSGGFSGTYSTAAAGSMSSASWTLAVTPSDTGWGTEVSATWTPSCTNANNATYTVYDGSQATGTILGTVVINQTKAPVGTADGNFQFQELGVFFPTLSSNGDGTLTVVLNANSANGKVVADAVGAAQAWASTGGPSSFELEPSYQTPFQSTGSRTTPDVSFDASENSGVDTYFQGSLGYGSFGTSLSSPCWAGLIAIANQGRVAYGGTTLNSPANPQQTLQFLYSLPSSDYNQITTGYNGFSAGPGYNEVTGLGTPIANLLVPALASDGLLILSPGTLSSGTYGSAYNQTIAATEAGGAGGPYTFAITAGALPAGLSLATGGALSGTPTGVGTFSFTVTVTATDSGGVTDSQAYTLTVTPAPLTVSGITAANKVYSASSVATLNTSRAMLVGVFSGDTVKLNTGGATGTFASLDVGTGITVTVVGLTISGPQAGDYSLTEPKTTANITPAPLTVRASTNESMTYGGTVPTLTYTYTGLVNGDTTASFTGRLSTTATASSSVGAYPIAEGTLTATGNYMIATFKHGTVTVTLAPLTVRASTNETMTYGGKVPALNYTYTGLVNGNTTASFTGTLNTTAKSSSNVGSFPITEGSLVATGNYTIGTFEQGTLTINPASTKVSLTPTHRVKNGKITYELMVTVTTTVPGGPVPVGVVNFQRNGRTFASAMLQKGSAVISLGRTKSLNKKFQALFQGSQDFSSSSSPTVVY
jgi:hypothetical protein